jgi:predicted SnoaL-like aldol condensation-catalyzing enzyme
MAYRTARLAAAGMLAALCAASLVAVTPAQAAPAGPAGQPPGGGAGQPAGNEQIAVSFLERAFNEGDLTAIDELVLPDVIEHNPQSVDGAPALRDLVTRVRGANPQYQVIVKRVLAEGDLVLVHNNVVPTPGARGSAVVDIYRFEDGKIAEHWDVTQAVPQSTVSGNDMFGTVSQPPMVEPDPSASTAEARQIATTMFTELTVGRDVSALDRYCDPVYYQHNPQAPNGIAAVKSLFSSVVRNPGFSVEVKRVVAQNDYVAFHSFYKFSASDTGSVVFDLYRVRNGKIIEHWDISQPFPTNSRNPHPMF